MLRNYFLITFRNLLKNKKFVIINTLGMGIALACCIVAYLNYTFNAEFDSQHLNADKIYRINFYRITNGYPVKNGSSPMPLGNMIRESVSQVDKVVRIQPTGGNLKVGDELFRIRISAVEEEFFDVFTFPLVSGSEEGLKDKSTIYLSTETADKYFPNGNALGEIVTYVNDDQKIDYKVGGVFKKPPLNSSFQFDALVNYDNLREVLEWDYNNNWARFTTTFITVNDPSDIPAITQELQQYKAIQNKAKEDYKVEEYYLDPFEGMAQRAQREELWNHWFHSALPPAAVNAPVIMAVLILLIACFNFTNTSIAIANRRLKEIGIRKVMGSRRGQLIAQFMGENLILALFSLIIAIGIAWFLVPAYSDMWPFLAIELNFRENIEFWGFLVFLLVATGIISGSYPAFYISKFHPTSILRGTLKFGGTNTLMQILLTLQYTISIIAIISAIVFTRNAKYQLEYDIGFTTRGIIFAQVNGEDEYQAYYNELAKNPDIREIAGSTHNVAYTWYTDPVILPDSELDVKILDIGHNYLNTVSTTLIEGRDFIKDSHNDAEQSAIVTETLVKKMGWDEPVGQRILLKDTIQLYVTGVVKDIYLNALWDPVDPVVLRFTLPENYRYITVNTSPDNARAVYDHMEKVWNELFPEKLSTVRYLDEIHMEETAEINRNIMIIFVFLGIVAVLLSASGLYSMVTLNVIKKMKEIGVRKVFGASIAKITFLINKQFVVILLASALLGSAAGYYLVDSLMKSIWVYYTDVEIFAIIISILVIFSISIITVGQRVFDAASANPADTLRDE